MFSKYSVSSFLISISLAYTNNTGTSQSNSDASKSVIIFLNAFLLPLTLSFTDINPSLIFSTSLTPNTVPTTPAVLDILPPLIRLSKDSKHILVSTLFFSFSNSSAIFAVS